MGRRRVDRAFAITALLGARYTFQGNRLRPDFKTIADFRRDNREAFRQVFRDFVRLCRDLDLYGRELLAVDGTRIMAVDNVNRNFTRAELERELKSAEERLERYLRQMDEVDADDPSGGGVVDLEAKIEALRKRRATLTEYRDKLEKAARAGVSMRMRIRRRKREASLSPRNRGFS